MGMTVGSPRSHLLRHALPRRPLVTGDGSDAVIRLGSEHLSWMAAFYIFPALTNGMK